MDDESWDVESDLHFLFANDVELQTDLAAVCDLLDKSESESAAASVSSATATKRKRKPSTAPSGARNPHQSRQRQELEDLQRQVLELKSKLDEAKLHAAFKQEMSPAESLARLRQADAALSLKENKQLKDALDVQNSFIGKLGACLRKKPRHEILSSDDWRVYKLAAQKSLREAAIRAIADRQLRRKDSAFINAGLMDCTEYVFRSRTIKSQNPHAVTLEVTMNVELAAPRDVISGAVWHVFSCDTPPGMSQHTTVFQERLDAFTLYEQFSEVAAGGAMTHSNLVRKFYGHDNHDQDHVILWRSVLEDAMVPHMADGTVEDECGWIAISPIDATSCRLAFLLHAVFDPTTLPRGAVDQRSVEAMTAAVDKLNVVDVPRINDGTFPSPTKPTLPSPPQLAEYAPFIERGNQFEIALSVAVNAAIQKFQNGLCRISQ
ncbi:hypothetical protein, variant [Aphanomyces astaci]|uniref:START domain-containing protein n=1 Tax=Aphanomyces astaci TaxID=112090 RepID=W4GHK8_APHAT|nr:hypothetical protein, variant [Aphanomyces astaci]ETV78524.1 hypothetical protein, variant [Aphanomyces astaci]|eukprot:XP_009832104.1 hypothetical protein, variant [Aphanomyces astaci]